MDSQTLLGGSCPFPTRRRCSACWAHENSDVQSDTSLNGDDPIVTYENEMDDAIIALASIPPDRSDSTHRLYMVGSDEQTRPHVACTMQSLEIA